MGKNTRYSELLFHIMSPELRAEFFAEDEENKDDGWDLFETIHPEKAEVLVDLLQPHLAYVIKELQFKRDYDALLSKGDNTGAARLRVMHSASKLDF